MGIFNFCFASFLRSGNGDVDIVVPGTFAGVSPADPTGAGRYLKSVFVWSGNAADGDAITTMELSDDDGVVPVPVRAAFPSYPILIDFLDTVAGQTKQFPLPPNGTTVEAIDSMGLPVARFIPAQLHLKLTFAAGGINLGRSWRGIIRWGAWT